MAQHVQFHTLLVYGEYYGSHENLRSLMITGKAKQIDVVGS